MNFYAPPITPERQYIIDRRIRESEAKAKRDTEYAERVAYREERRINLLKAQEVLDRESVPELGTLGPEVDTFTICINEETINKIWRRLNTGFSHETTKDQIWAVLWAAVI